MPDPGFDRRVEELFTACVNLGAAERERALAVEPDLSVSRRVSALLVHDRPEEAPTAGGVRRAVGSGGHPAAVGRYRIIRPLGEGGFGVVYEAEQSEPVRRSVAIKLIKPGMDSDAVLARFEAERQSLAAMSHPCIASVFDAGTTTPEEGARPYFVMELVDGSPLTTFCDEHRLALDARVRLLARICDGVQHAHAKGVVHRDLKPANILVAKGSGGEPIPKVIDFGVAKALDADEAAFTRQGQVIGTPAYMSPEQAAGDIAAIDTRTDVYSLGAILYELLTGQTPFEPSDTHAIADVQRMIRESEPVRPSVRLATGTDGRQRTTVADHRSTDARSLAARLRRDLDWVVMKCLDKDPDRRYASANELAADLRRFLDGLPVDAGPPSFSYRASKFVRRNRVAVGFGAAAAAALLAATGVSTGMLVWALGERDAARTQAVAAEVARQAETNAKAAAQTQQAQTDRMLIAMQDLLSGVEIGSTPADIGGVRDSILGSFDVSLRTQGFNDAERSAELARLGSLLTPSLAGSVATGAIDRLMIAPWQQMVEERFADDPELLAELLEPVGIAAANLGIGERARKVSTRVVELRTAMQGTNHPATIRARCTLVQLQIEAGERGAVDEADSLYQDSARSLGLDHELTLKSRRVFASALSSLRRFEEAEGHYLAVIDSLAASPERDHHAYLNALTSFSSLLLRRRQFDEALDVAGQAVDLSTELHGPDHFRTLSARHNRASAWLEIGRIDEAEPEFRDTIDLRRQIFGDDHPNTLVSMGSLIMLLLREDRAAEALGLSESVYDARFRTLGPDHHDTLVSARGLAEILAKTGDMPGAIELFTTARDRAAISLGDQHPLTNVIRLLLGTCLRDTGRLDDANTVMRAAVDGLAGAPMSIPYAYDARRNLADLCVRREHWDEARERYEALLDYHLGQGGSGLAAVLSIQFQLTRIDAGSGRVEQAIGTARALLSEMRDSDHPEQEACEQSLAAWQVGD